MKSPWKSIADLEPDREYLAFASAIPPKSRRSTPRLFAGAMAVQKQLRHTNGVVGFSLPARPLKKEYATLSVWVDDEALAAFAFAGAPHNELMARLAPEMGSTTFVRWSMKGSAGRPSWDEAMRRLAAAK